MINIEDRFPKIQYPTTRTAIAEELKIGLTKLRAMMRKIGISDHNTLMPIDIQKFRKEYIDGYDSKKL